MGSRSPLQTAPDGNIYYNKPAIEFIDFSTLGEDGTLSPEDVQAMATFIHEMGHVKQHADGVSVPVARNFNSDYDYSDKLLSGVDFKDWSIEEQAEFNKDLFLVGNGLEDVVFGSNPFKTNFGSSFNGGHCQKKTG